MNVSPTSLWMLLQLDLHRLTELEVERAERLVEQQHPRPHHERARERDPLSLAARQLPRLPIAECPAAPSRVHPPTRSRRSRPDLPHHEPVADVVGDASCAGTARSPGRPCSRRARTGAARVTSRPSGRCLLRRGLEARDHPQARRLPAARRSEQREELAARGSRGPPRRPRPRRRIA